MNLILFTKEEISNPLDYMDPRYLHIKKILKIGVGDTFDAGIIGGTQGIAEIQDLKPGGMVFKFTPNLKPSALYPVTLIIGIPRPPTARRLLKDMTSTGIDQMWFTGTELGEKSYLTSKIWKDGKYMEYVMEGAQQGESTLLPEIRNFYSLKSCIKEILPGDRCALDNNESSQSINQFKPQKKRVIIAIGSERGWTKNERNILKENDFTLLSMGSRVLRTETACSMGIGFILSALGHI